MGNSNSFKATCSRNHELKKHMQNDNVYKSGFP